MPLLYRSQYSTTEIAPRPLFVSGTTAAELGPNFDRIFHALYTRIQEHFSARQADVYYDPARQQIEIDYRLPDTIEGVYFQFQAIVAALMNVADVTTPGAAGGAELYPVVSTSVKRIQHGYWTVFDNSENLHQQFANEIRGLLTPPPTAQENPDAQQP